jgi:hypothetical protein
MNILQILIVFFAGLAIGGMVYKVISEWYNKIKKDVMLKGITEQFKQILSNISRGKSEFKNRVNNTVFIKSELKDHGEVDIVYMMDSKDIAIFQKEKCIYTSSSIESNVTDDIVFTIEKRYKKQINDIVEVLGFKFYRPDFEKTFNINPDQMKGMNQPSDIEVIQQENDSRFDIDDILDKIGKKGMDSLSNEEKVFLEDYSKNNG